MIDNYKSLVAAIIIKAAEDIRKNKDDKDKKTAITFIKSNWCRQLCELININYTNLKNTLLINEV